MNSILITGSNRGIGLGLVKAFLKEENPPKHILATYRKLEDASELKSLAETHKNVNMLQLDVQQYDAYGNFAKNVLNIVNKEGLNLLINNAGIAHKFLRINSLKREPMAEAFNINCIAPTMLVKELLPLLKQASENNAHLPVGSQRAAIVNISSILGSISENDQGGFYPYRCSKAALNAMTKSLSVDLRPLNIMATSLHPGWIKTRLGGPKAPLEVDDACEVIVKTIKNLSSEHNGEFYSFDGSKLKW